MKNFVTTLGNFEKEQLGIILPHEHIFADVRENEDIKRSNPPKMEEIKKAAVKALVKAGEAGVSALVDATPVGVSRDTALISQASREAGMPVMFATGVYYGPYIPEWVHKARQLELEDWMYRELTEEVHGAGARAGFIKVATFQELNECENKVIRAAANVAASTGCVIGSHSCSAGIAAHQLDILEQAGVAPDRFIWIHTWAENDFTKQLEMAKRGVWLSYDAVCVEGTDELFTDYICKMMDAGFAGKMMISQDTGIYDIRDDGSFNPEFRPYEGLITHFLPELRKAGIDDAAIRRLTCDNPFEAFAR